MVTIHGTAIGTRSGSRSRRKRVTWNGRTFNVYPDRKCYAAEKSFCKEFMAWLQGSALATPCVSQVCGRMGCEPGPYPRIASFFGAIVCSRFAAAGRLAKDLSVCNQRACSARGATGFVIAALSGICLLATKATDYVGNPFLYIKCSRDWPGAAERGPASIFYGLEGT